MGARQVGLAPQQESEDSDDEQLRPVDDFNCVPHWRGVGSQV